MIPLMPLVEYNFKLQKTIRKCALMAEYKRVNKWLFNPFLKFSDDLMNKDIIQDGHYEVNTY